MSSRSREKIALVVFAGLIVLSLCGLGWYLLAGHSWNVAASNLDDTFGSMDGYTAIVYPGTEPPKAAAPDKEDAADGKAPVPDAAEGSAANPPAAGSSSGESPVEDPAAKALEGQGAAAGVGGAADVQEAPKAAAKALDAADAKEAYEAKGATVFSLDTTDPGTYGEGVILKKDGHRFGVFGIEAPTSSIMLEKQVAAFKRAAVDFIVVVTPDKEYVEGVAGIDIAISTQDEDLFVMGETIGGTFYVDAPTVGSVGAILISPSNVVSAKVLQGE